MAPPLTLADARRGGGRQDVDRGRSSGASPPVTSWFASVRPSRPADDQAPVRDGLPSVGPRTWRAGRLVVDVIPAARRTRAPSHGTSRVDARQRSVRKSET